MEKKTKIKLLAIQMGSEIARNDENILKVEKLLEDSLSRYEADFVFLPEVWNVGWDCSSFQSCAEDFENSESLAMLMRIAKKYAVNIIGGSIIQKKSEREFFNACPVINRNGDLVCTYEKTHLFSYYGCDEGFFVKCGQNPVVVELEGIKIGLSICYDIRFPELYRAYRKNGADILVNMAAWGYEKRIPWVSMTTSRAVENQSYFVALTQTGFLKDGARNLGYSSIIDYKGEVIADIEGDEGCIYAELDLEKMYEFRAKCTVLNDIKKSYEVNIL